MSDGFRPGQSTHTILKKIKTKWIGQTDILNLTLKETLIEFNEMSLQIYLTKKLKTKD